MSAPKARRATWLRRFVRWWSHRERVLTPEDIYMEIQIANLRRRKLGPYIAEDVDGDGG